MTPLHAARAGCLMVLLACGCGGGPKTAAIEGEVRLRDGTPLPSGVIHFIPQDVPGAKPVFARIEQGRYRLAAENGPALGKHRLELLAYRPGKDGEVVEEDGRKATVSPEQQYLPARYNTESQEFIEVVAGANTKDIVLDVK